MNFQKVIITAASAAALLLSACGESPKINVEAMDSAALNGASQDAIVNPVQAYTKEVSGTIVSEMEHFAFTPTGDEASHWINNDSYKAQDWDILEDVHQSLKEKQWKAKLPNKAIYMCVTGFASVQDHAKGIGHRSLWKSDIIFTKILSVKTGKCAFQAHLKLSFEDDANVSVQKEVEKALRQDLVPASLDSDYGGLIGLDWIIQELNGANPAPASAEEWLAEPTHPYFSLYRQQDGDVILEGYTGCNMFRGPVYQETGNSERLHTPKVTLISERNCDNSERKKQQNALLDILTTENIWQNVTIKYQNRLSLGQEPDVKLKALMLLGGGSQKEALRD